MRVLVTGAAGFIGTALCRELHARGHAVRAVVRDAAQSAAAAGQSVAVADIAGEFDRRVLLDGIDVVVHLAAIAHRASGDAAAIRRVNVDGATRLA